VLAASPNNAAELEIDALNRSRRTDSPNEESSPNKVFRMTANVDHQPQPSGPELYGVQVYVAAVCGF
jgi:hypothetical protein